MRCLPRLIWSFLCSCHAAKRVIHSLGRSAWQLPAMQGCCRLSFAFGGNKTLASKSRYHGWSGVGAESEIGLKFDQANLTSNNFAEKKGSTQACVNSFLNIWDFKWRVDISAQIIYLKVARNGFQKLNLGSPYYRKIYLTNEVGTINLFYVQRSLSS